MPEFNFNNKIFSLIDNSENGQVNSETLFKYKQDGNLITADYSGGSVIYGKIVGKLNKDKIEMLYQCLTLEEELKAGKAIATISLTKDNKIKLKLHWQWLNDTNEKGTSEYIEN
ncbi:hypothetical protein [Hyunsoonleella ulvae]|uniref:hypothetical protein n=1 Tax=Hyunsoonleella ulvae TaxID=2799948 RepID=UPI00193A5ED7|nr:hypothetical protein [Hyunsoonleella ulvae]